MGGILIPDFDVTFGSFIREHGAPADSDQQASRRGPHPMTTTIEDVKRQAKRIARTTTVTHAQALDVLAVQHGFTHWSAYSRHLETGSRTDAAPVRAGTATGVPYRSVSQGIRAVLENMLGGPAPGADGCRHLIVSGSAASGKTTFVNRMLTTLPAGTRVVAIEDVCEIVLPPESVSITVPRMDYNRGDERAIAEALALAPDMIVCEMTTTNVVPLMEVMALVDGPVIVSLAHTDSAAYVRTIVEIRTRDAARPDVTLPDDVAVVQLNRDPLTGGRRIA
jgi:hypothetical protein